MDVLETHVALGAFHNSAERFDPTKCHPQPRGHLEEDYAMGRRSFQPSPNHVEIWSCGSREVCHRPEHRGFLLLVRQFGCKLLLYPSLALRRYSLDLNL